MATELTAMMLATLFDFPFEDRRKLSFWSDVAIADTGAEDAVVKSQEERMGHLHEMAVYFGAFILDFDGNKIEVLTFPRD